MTKSIQQKYTDCKKAKWSYQTRYSRALRQLRAARSINDMQQKKIQRALVCIKELEAQVGYYKEWNLHLNGKG